MDVRDLLSLDHREALQLARLLGRSDNPDCRIAAHRKLQDVLRAHARAEEGVVHAALAHVLPDALAPMQHGRLEHALVAHLMGRLAHALPRPDGWQATWHELVSTIERHVEDEEAQLYDQLSSCFSCAERHALATHFLAARREVAAADGVATLHHAAPAFA